MSRLKIQLPTTKLPGTFTIPVRITDINYGNHVGNHSIVEILHEARMQFLHAHGYNELDIGGAALIMNELLVSYKNEAFYGDWLLVELFCGEITPVSFELYYRIFTVRDENPIEVATAKTGLVGYNYDIKRISPLPAPFLLILSGNQAGDSKSPNFPAPE